MPQGIDEDYNGVMDAEEVPQAGEPDLEKLKLLLAKLVEMLGLGDAGDPGEEELPLNPPAPKGPEPVLLPPDDQSAIETDMRGGKSFDEFHGTDLEGSGSFQPPAGNKDKLKAFQSKLKVQPK